MTKNTLFLLSVVFALSIVPLFHASAQERVVPFSYPDIRNDFCGTHINAQFCRCAFHDEGCEAVNHTQPSARDFVRGEFRTWVGILMSDFARSCLDSDGIWNRINTTCTHCEQGYVKKSGRCLEASDIRSVKEIYNLPDIDDSPPATQELRGHIHSSNGEVFIYMAAFGVWRGPIDHLQPIYNGDIIITRNDSEAQVTLFGKTGEDTVNIGPATHFRFARPPSPAEPETWMGFLKNGAIHLYKRAIGEYEPPKVDSWHIRSPMAMLGTRGTELIFSHNEETGVSSVALLNGFVDASFPENEHDDITLLPGKTATVGEGFVETGELEEGEWQGLLSEHGFSFGKIADAGIDYSKMPGFPVDPDSVVPVEAVNNLMGDLSDIDLPSGSSRSVFWIILIVAALGGAGWFYTKKKNLFGK